MSSISIGDIGDPNIVCECGDDFISEEEFQKHIENNHEKKDPAPEVSDWGEDFNKKELKVETNKKYFDSNENSVITDAPKSPIKYCQKESFPNVLDKESSGIAIKTEPCDLEQVGSVITIKSETNLQMVLSFDDIFANEMVLSHEEVIENKDSSPITVKLEKSVDIEPVERDSFYPTEEILRNNFSQKHITNEEPIVCALCFREFTNARSMGIHFARSHKETRFESKKPKTSVLKNRICEICGKAFASIASLTYHQRIHTGERPYLCSYCNKGFTMPLLLQIHVRTHTGERPYQCPHCPKAFGNKAAINRHNRVHTGVKPYACPKCGKTFTQSNSMKLHVNTVHLKQPAPYKSKKRIEAERERDKLLHSYVRTMKRSAFKEKKKDYMSVYSTLT